METPAQYPTIDELARAFGFTLDELARNRRGKLSLRQRQQVVFQSIGYIVRGVAFLVLGGVLAAALVPTLNRRWEWAAFVGMCAVLVGLAAYLAFAAVRIARPVVRTATGPLVRAGSANRPRVRVGSLDLRVPFRRWKRLPLILPGRYRAYYARGVYNLLSIERVA